VNEEPIPKIARIREHSRKINPHGRYDHPLLIKIMKALLEGSSPESIQETLKVSLDKIRGALIWTDLLNNNEEAKQLGETLAKEAAKRHAIEQAKIQAKKDPDWRSSRPGDLIKHCEACDGEQPHRNDICIKCVRS
jgi:hypothetical protein